MADSVKVPVELSVDDIDLQLDKSDLTKTKKSVENLFSDLQTYIGDVLGNIDTSSLDKSLKKALSDVQKQYVSTMAMIEKFNVALDAGARSSKQYKRLADHLKEVQVNMARAREAILPEPKFEKALDMYKQSGNDLKAVEKSFGTVVANSVQFFVDSEHIFTNDIEQTKQLMEKVASSTTDLGAKSLTSVWKSVDDIIGAYTKLINATDTWEKEASKTRVTDEYAAYQTQLDKLSKKMSELDNKSKKMSVLGAPTEAWNKLEKETESVNYDIDQTVKKMRSLITSGKAFQGTFSDEDKKMARKTVSEYTKKQRDANKSIKSSVAVESPYSVQFQDYFKQLDALNKQVDKLKEKSRTMLVTGASDKSIQSLNNQIDRMSVKIAETGEHMKQMVHDGSAFRLGSGDEDRAVSAINSQLSKMTTSLQDSRLAMNSNKTSANGFFKVFGKAGPTIQKVVKGIKTGFKGAGKVFSTLDKRVASVVKTVGKLSGRIFSSVKNMNIFHKSGRRTTSDLGKKFNKLGKNILMFGLGFRSLYYLIKSIRKVFTQSFGILATQSDEVNSSISELVTAFSQLKASVATAFQPIASAVIPVLTKIIQVVNEFANSVGRLFAILTNQQYIYKATAANIDYADSINKINDASYDELNVIQKNDNNITFEKEDITDSVGGLAGAIKQALSDLDFSDVGTIISEKLSDALTSFDTNLLPAITGKLQSIVTGISSFFSNIDASQLGTDFGNIINDMINNIDAESVGNAIGNYINTIVTLISTFISTTDWVNLANTIVTGLITAFNSIDFTSLFTNIAGMSASLVSWIIESISNMDLESIITKLGESIYTIFSGASTVLGESDNPIVNSLGETVSALEQSFTNLLPAIQSIISAIGPIVSAILPAINQLLPPIADLINSLAVMAMPLIVSLVEALMPMITNLVTSLLPPIQSILEVIFPILTDLVNMILPLIKDLLDIITPILVTLGDLLAVVLKPVLERINAVIGFIAPILHIIFVAIKPVINIIAKLVSFIAKLVDTITDIDKLKSAFVSFGKTISSVFTKVWNKVKEVWDDIIGSCKSGINKIIDPFESFVNFIISGINKLISGINKLSFDIPDWAIFGDLAGKKFGLNIPEIPTVQIPRLAQGAVIPPNKEFLAMLGDQRRGTNIEAPLDTIKQALVEVLKEYGTGKEPIILQVNGKTLAQVVWDETEKRYRQTGKSVMNY